jgi:hypothetical protein
MKTLASIGQNNQSKSFLLAVDKRANERPDRAYNEAYNF